MMINAKIVVKKVTNLIIIFDFKNNSFSWTRSRIAHKEPHITVERTTLNEGKESFNVLLVSNNRLRFITFFSKQKYCRWNN